MFLWACFYIPEAEFRWTIEIGDREYGLCHIKAMIYFAFGGGRIYVPLAFAAATVALAVGLPALVLMFLTTNIWSKIRKHETQMA